MEMDKMLDEVYQALKKIYPGITKDNVAKILKAIYYEKNDSLPVEDVIEYVKKLEFVSKQLVEFSNANARQCARNFLAELKGVAQ